MLFAAVHESGLPARNRWQALEQALADFAVAALAFEQD
jgi:hypothetical protein